MSENDTTKYISIGEIFGAMMEQKAVFFGQIDKILDDIQQLKARNEEVKTLNG